MLTFSITYPCDNSSIVLRKLKEFFKKFINPEGFGIGPDYKTNPGVFNIPDQ